MKLLLFGVSLVFAFPTIPQYLEKVDSEVKTESKPVLEHEELAEHKPLPQLNSIPRVSKNLTGNVNDLEVPQISSLSGRKTQAQNSTFMGRHVIEPAFTEQKLNVSTFPVGVIPQNKSSQNLSKSVLFPNSTVKNVTMTHTVLPNMSHVEQNASQDAGLMKSGNVTVSNVTVTKRSLISHLRNLSGTVVNKKQNKSRNTNSSEAVRGRKLLQSQLQTERVRSPVFGEEKVSSLKNYQSDFPERIKQSAIYNYTELFWKDVQKWAVDLAQFECPDIMNKWFSSVSEVQLNGLPTSLSMIGKNSSVCKVVKRSIVPASFDWQSDFFNDLTSSAMGSVWITGKSARNGMQLPGRLELVFYMQFDPETFKIAQLEVVPVEPEVIFEALASKPVKSYHHIIRTVMDEGFSSPALLNLLSDKFVLEVPNLFLEKSDFKTKFTKADLQQFMDQDVKIFDFEDAKIESFSLPFYDEKSVVSEIRFDELPMKSSGLVLEDLKFWITHTFDCKDNISIEADIKENRTSALGSNARRTQEKMTSTPKKVESKPQEVEIKISNPKSELDFCLLERVQVTVDRPISMLAQLAFESKKDTKINKEPKFEKYNISA